ncbi:MAG TPA: 2-phospho-L-lactate guanylyltransferase [Anaerolineaceae bacterium]|jgi:2-phospho-L-lactate guanylyltransferase|nr:2-phospho-L-lactate guanylyltransferase [Anaerolineaceae bacterium]
MGLWAIVPVKPLRRGKSRLASVLSEDERALLNFTMLSSTLRTLREVEEIEHILVVSRDPAALSLAREYNARTVQEDGQPELNTALQRATVVAQMYAAQEILILPADLPLLSVNDVKRILQQAKNPPVVVISPDRRNDGTNALYMNPAGVIEYRYGPGSFHQHVEQARAKGVRVEICHLSTLSLDLDLPEDLDLLKQIEAMQIEP